MSENLMDNTIFLLQMFFFPTCPYFVTLLILHFFHVTSQCGPGVDNRDKNLALYKIVLRTYWSRERFPKHYPQWNPPAQFGKLIGRTHDSTYSLYRLGERLSLGSLQYIGTGNSDGLDIDGELPNVLDSFEGRKVRQGEGTSVTRAFLDSNHTLVSIIMRINPSPDWFIGVDSFSLCIKGKWVDTVSVELDPLDGGTDNGLSFMARDWPTKPQGITYRITSRYPAHRASSFYYPHLPRLPPIATLTFQKLKEYTLNATFHDNTNNNVEMEFISGVNENEATNSHKYRYWTARDYEKLKLTTESDHRKGMIMDNIASSYGSSRARIFPQKIGGSYDDHLKERKKQKITRKMVGAIIGNDMQNMISSADSSVKNTTLHQSREQHGFRKMKQHQVSHVDKGKRYRSHAPRDCKVGEWSAWNACSRSCGVGETQRTRKIIVKSRRGGASCPSLKETKWCGSINPCPKK